MKIKIFLIFFSFLCFADLSLAGGFCLHNKGQAIHEDFCSRVNEENCKVHGNICNWIEVDEPKKPVAKPAYNCLPRHGNESLEEICMEYQETMCKVHTRLCEWR